MAYQVKDTNDNVYATGDKSFCEYKQGKLRLLNIQTTIQNENNNISQGVDCSSNSGNTSSSSNGGGQNIPSSRG